MTAALNPNAMIQRTKGRTSRSAEPQLRLHSNLQALNLNLNLTLNLHYETNLNSGFETRNPLNSKLNPYIGCLINISLSGSLIPYCKP